MKLDAGIVMKGDKMKASERLRELRRLNLETGDSAVVLAALPLIADVVEAAERPSTWARQTPEMRAAVTALRDALQPEPPGWGADRRCPETCG